MQFWSVCVIIRHEREREREREKEREELGVGLCCRERRRGEGGRREEKKAGNDIHLLRPITATVRWMHPIP